MEQPKIGQKNDAPMGKIKSDPYRWVILLVLIYVSGVGSYFQFQMPPLAPKLMAEMGLTVQQFQSVFSAPMIASLLLGIVAGMLVDKFGVKLILGLAIILSSLGIVLRLTASSYFPLFIYMILGGLAGAFIGPSGAKIIAGYFPRQQIPLFVGIVWACGSLVRAISTATSALFSSLNSAFVFAAVLAVASPVIWWIFFRNPKKLNIAQPGKPAQPTVSLGEGLKRSLKSRDVLLAGLCMFCVMSGAIAYTGLLPKALQSRGISAASAGLLASLATLGGVLGALALPALAKATGRQKPIMWVVAVFAAIGIAFSWLTPTGFLLGLAIFITGVFFGGIVPFITAIPVQLPEIGRPFAASAGGILTTLQMLGSVLTPTYIIATIAKDNMNLFFLLAGIAFALNLILILFLPEMGSKGKINGPSSTEEVNRNMQQKPTLN